MDDPQEFKSLDDLFRKTFDDLPDNPAATGWDKPSPRVWEQVSTQIKAPKSGWTGKSILLMSALAIVLMLGLYWALTQVKQPTTQPAVEQTTTPAATLEAPAQSPENQETIETGNTEAAQVNKQQIAQTLPSRPIKSKTPDSDSNNTQREGSGQLQRQLAGSAPLPGSNPVSPNTTVRRQMEAWRGAPWAQPLAPLPSILESTFIRPVPEGLKNLGN